MKLSLIIPIYNVEKYIIDCLESIFSQLSSDIEVILIDDGSPDRSMEIASGYINEKYYQYIDQVQFIKKKNGGVSSVRNKGIELARGDYIAFLDSDDLLANKYFDFLLKIIKEKEPDIIEFNAIRFNGDNKQILKLTKDDDVCLVMNDEVWDRITEKNLWYLWLRIYRKNIFKNISFPLDVNFEDAYILPHLYLNSETIYSLNKELYFYRENFSGITSTVSKKSVEDLEFVILHLMDLSKIKTQIYKSCIILAKYYIGYSLNSEGFFVANKRWRFIKYKLKKSKPSNLYFGDYDLSLFYVFGVCYVLILTYYLRVKNFVRLWRAK
ncbi:MAG: glycosyltransferase [Acinetobacter ursingii]|nr:glycosyltransferase [Acinetobacter ursingii]